MIVSVIVPMLNEALQLPALLDSLNRIPAHICEVVFVDGGSSDGSPQLARASGYEVIAAGPGRARQMNAGAHAACGDILLFLHADTLLPDSALPQVIAALSDATEQWGRFDVTISGESSMFKIVGLLMNLRSRLTGVATGDQGIFLRRATFLAIGGFADQPLMEDIDLSCRLRAIARPVCLRGPAITSGRRWERRGIWATILLMWRLRFLYWLGIPASQLMEKYR